MNFTYLGGPPNQTDQAIVKQMMLWENEKEKQQIIWINQPIPESNPRHKWKWGGGEACVSPFALTKKQK